ncbi:MAG TPA: sugar ABC transporter substrate-binding protein [Longimicrobiales bacterium]|nr:sugar ABC transporter substrate-binding protein [Longimicrobiales bacterium]
MRRGVVTVAAYASVGLAVACGRGGPEPSEARDVRIVVVTHGQSADPFWSVVANGVRDAARDLGVRVEYQAPGSFDLVAMNDLIEAAVASRPSGLVVSIPDGDALAPAIRGALEAGVPVISINSGDDVYEALGVLAHVGQPEYEAGRAGGARLVEVGVEEALCVNHEVGNLALDARCSGLAEALEASGGSVEVLAVDLADPDDTQQRVAGALSRAVGIDGILTLGPAATGPTLAAVRASERSGEIFYGTFDPTPEVLRAVRDGEMLFAIDQQQYLQGYLAVVLMTKYLEIRAMPGGGGVIATGPGFVTAESAADVIELSERGVR